MALYFECGINKIALLQTVFGDFAHWVNCYINVSFKIFHLVRFVLDISILFCFVLDISI